MLHTVDLVDIPLSSSRQQWRVGNIMCLYCSIHTFPPWCSLRSSMAMAVDLVLIGLCWLYCCCSIIKIFDNTITSSGRQFFRRWNPRGKISMNEPIRHPFFTSLDSANAHLRCLWIISLTWRTLHDIVITDGRLCWVQWGMLDCFFYIWGARCCINICAWFLDSPQQCAAVR